MEKIIGLQYLRAIAVLFVVIFHALAGPELADSEIYPSNIADWGSKGVRLYRYPVTHHACNYTSCLASLWNITT